MQADLFTPGREEWSKGTQVLQENIRDMEHGQDHSPPEWAITPRHTQPRELRLLLKSKQRVGKTSPTRVRRRGSPARFGTNKSREHSLQKPKKHGMPGLTPPEAQTRRQVLWSRGGRGSNPHSAHAPSATHYRSEHVSPREPSCPLRSWCEG